MRKTYPILHVSNNIFKDIIGIPIAGCFSTLRSTIKNIKIAKNMIESLNLRVPVTSDRNTAIWSS